MIDGKELELGDQLKYLGNILSEDGYCDIKARIVMAKSMVEKHTTSFTDCLRSDSIS